MWSVTYVQTLMIKFNIGRHYESFVSACGVNKVADYLVRRRLVAAA